MLKIYKKKKELFCLKRYDYKVKIRIVKKMKFG